MDNFVGMSVTSLVKAHRLSELRLEIVCVETDDDAERDRLTAPLHAEQRQIEEVLEDSEPTSVEEVALILDYFDRIIGCGQTLDENHAELMRRAKTYLHRLPTNR